MSKTGKESIAMSIMSELDRTLTDLTEAADLIYDVVSDLRELLDQAEEAEEARKKHGKRRDQ